MSQGQHVFFQEFGIPPTESPIPPNPQYLRNTLVLEIFNNWPFARWLMDRYRNGLVKKVDLLEQDWLKFIISNNIDLEKYGKNSEKFLEDFLLNENKIIN
jgi:hypothetical protein